MSSPQCSFSPRHVSVHCDFWDMGCFPITKSFRKLSGWKVNGHDFLGRFIGKFSRATEYLKRLSCFPGPRNVSSRTEKPSLIPVSCRFSRPFFEKWNWFVHYGKRGSWRNLPVLNSLDSTQTVNRPVFTHVNGNHMIFHYKKGEKPHYECNLRYWKNSWLSEQLSTATTPLWFGFFQCRVDVLQIWSALQIYECVYTFSTLTRDMETQFVRS